MPVHWIRLLSAPTGDFMFQLTPQEVAQLNRSQIVIGSEKHRDLVRRTLSPAGRAGKQV